MMTYEQFKARKQLKRRIKRAVVLALCLALFVVFIIFIIKGAAKLVSAIAKRSDSVPTGVVMTPDEFGTPTPTPTPVSIDGLVRRDPKDNHELVLRIKSDYENNKTVNVRANPSQKSAQLGTLNVGDEIQISCSFSDPENKGYTGFLGAELGFGRQVVWVYNLYVDLSDIIEPWAVTLPYDYGYSQKYGKSRVTIRSKDGNADANVRSIPWEAENSSYGRVLVNTTFVADKVYVSGDQQWFGFPAASLNNELDNVLMDPDGIVWIYQAYCTIDKIKQ